MEDVDPGAWRVLERHVIAEMDPWVRLWSEHVQLPDGRTVEGFATLQMPDYVVMVAFTPNGEVVIERNYKHGPRRRCLNLPAGFIELDEEPAEAARRELLEETGYVAEDWRSLGAFSADGNRGGGTGHFLLARHARRVAEPNSGDLEELEVGTLPLEDLVAAAVKGDIAVLAVAAAVGLAAAVVAADPLWVAKP